MVQDYQASTTPDFYSSIINTDEYVIKYTKLNIFKVALFLNMISNFGSMFAVIFILIGQIITRDRLIEIVVTFAWVHVMFRTNTDFFNAYPYENLNVHEACSTLIKLF